MLLFFHIEWWCNLIFFPNCLMWYTIKIGIGEGETCWANNTHVSRWINIYFIRFNNILHKDWKCITKFSPEAKERRKDDSTVACWKPFFIVVAYGLSIAHACPRWTLTWEKFGSKWEWILKRCEQRRQRHLAVESWGPCRPGLSPGNYSSHKQEQWRVASNRQLWNELDFFLWLLG